MASSLGVEDRLRRLQGPGRRLLLVAIDHGLPAGPLRGLEEPAAFLRSVRGAPLSGVILTAGLLPHVAPEIPRTAGLVVHLSAGTLRSARPTSKVLAASVRRAVALGADAVSLQVVIGDPQEDRMLAHAGAVVDDARRLGMPVLVMAYPPSEAGRTSVDAAACGHAARAAADLGASLVQTNYAGPPEGVRGIAQGCPAPLLLAGGPRNPSPGAFLEFVRAGIAAGAAGITVGRNLFQHPEPGAFAADIAAAVFSQAAPPVAVAG